MGGRGPGSQLLRSTINGTKLPIFWGYFDERKNESLNCPLLVSNVLDVESPNIYLKHHVPPTSEPLS